MTVQLPSLTARQLRVYEVVHKIRMAWVTLGVMLTCFVGVLIALICAAFSPTAGPWMRGAFATIDGLLGVSIHQIVRHLFPAKRAN
jgi:hypothetical protein